MNDRSRGKRHFPKGFPGEVDLEAIQKSEIAQSSDDSCHGCSTINWSDPYAKNTQKRVHLIRRAYSEPLGFNLIENILLQRNYIID